MYINKEVSYDHPEWMIERHLFLLFSGILWKFQNNYGMMISMQKYFG